jgi:carbon-monoxide dehydrogenase large subunit
MSLVYDGVSPQECLSRRPSSSATSSSRDQEGLGRSPPPGPCLSLYTGTQPSGGQGGSAAATIRIEPSGKVNVYMGSGSHGQSIETTMTQIVADEMGVNIEDVHFIQGDTDSTPYASITGGSRTAGVYGGAAHPGRAG